MINQRQKEILSILYGAVGTVDLSTLSELLNVSSKTIQTDIHSLNEFLSDDHQIILLKNQGYLFDNKNDELRNELLEIKFKSDRSHLNRSQIIMGVLAFEKDFISMEQLAQKLYISKTSISNEFKTNWRLHNFVKVSQQKGLKINLNEARIRLTLCRTFMLDLWIAKKIGISDYYNKYYNIIQQSVKDVFNQFHVFVSGNSFKQMTDLIFYSVVRNQMDYHLDDPYNGSDVNVVVRELIKSIEQSLEIHLSEADGCLIDIKFKQLGLLLDSDKIQEEVLNRNEFYENLKEFIWSVKKDFDIHLTFDEPSTERLYLYLNSAYVRYKSHTSLANFYKRKLTNEAILTSHIIRDYLVPIFKMQIPDSEIAYLIPFFSNQIEIENKTFRLQIVADELESIIYQWQDILSEIKFDFEVTEVIYTPSYIYQANENQTNDTTILLSTDNEFVIRHSNAIKIQTILNDGALNFSIKQINQMMNRCIKVHQEKNNIRFQEQTYLIQFTGTQSIESILLSRGVTDYNLDYKIILDERIAFYPRFITGEKPSNVEVLHFHEKKIDVNRQIEYLVITEFNTEEQGVHSFYSYVKKLIQQLS